VLLLAPAPDGGQSYRVAGCRSCGLGYLNPRPDERTVGLLYPDDYTWYHPPARPETLWGRARRGLKRLVMARRFGTPPAPLRWHQGALAWLAGWWLRPRPQSMTALPFQGEGRLLDFGCGSGWYAQQMRELGWRVTGMDFSAFAAERVSRHFGIPTLAGTLPHPQVAAASFDVITMGAVLEHVHHPHRLIAAAAASLRPGGYLVVSVPNLASWGFRRFRVDWWGLQLPHHLLHFTPQTLRRLLAGHGLEVRKLRGVPRPGWMQRSLTAAHRRRAREGRGGPFARLGRLRLVASLLARWTGWTGAADCLEAIAYRRVTASG
jgi:2-polyprenyl-3-methyl-5-hydroxy-6-metoxy-1,4-benzoquinol methylase